MPLLSTRARRKLQTPVLAGEATLTGVGVSFPISHPKIGQYWGLSGLTLIDESNGTGTVELLVGGETVDSFTFDNTSTPPLPATQYHAYVTPFVIYDATSLALVMRSAAPSPGYPRKFKFRGQVNYI